MGSFRYSFIKDRVHCIQGHLSILSVYGNCKWLANKCNIIRSRELFSNNKGLDEWERTAVKYEMIRLPSIFGGTSTY